MRDRIADQIAGLTVIVTLVVFFFVTIQQGIQVGLGAVAVARSVAFAGVGAGSVAGARAVAFAGAVAGAFVLSSIYIGWRALTRDEKYALIRNIAVSFAAFQGTNFCSADLIDANFTGATLKSTDFREAILTRTYFHKTKKLDRVRSGSTYLQKAQVRQVLVTRQGEDKNFDR